MRAKSLAQSLRLSRFHITCSRMVTRRLVKEEDYKGLDVDPMVMAQIRKGKCELLEERSKQETGACPLARLGDLLCLFSCVLPTEAPMSILALKLIAIIRGFAKTIKVTFPQLFFMNDWRDGLSKAGVAQG